MHEQRRNEKTANKSLGTNVQCKNEGQEKTKLKNETRPNEVKMKARQSVNEKPDSLGTNVRECKCKINIK